MAVNKKEKRKKEKKTDRWVPSVWMGVWTCGHAGVQMGVEPCGHADADSCKQKGIKNKLTGGFRACGWACRRADGHAETDDCKEKKRKEKRMTHCCSERADGHVDMLRMGVRGWACGQT